MNTLKKRLIPCEKYYENLNIKINDNLHHSLPFEKYFERIDYMIMKHVPKAYKLFKSLAIKNFGVPPSVHDFKKPRTF